MSDQTLSKKELWALRINDYRSSGFTAPEWCDQNNLSLSTFRYWIRKLGKKQNLAIDDLNPVFAKLPYPSSTPFFGSAPVTIHMGTIRIEIMETCHTELLSNLIGVLKSYA
jgi:hypothetical protein